VSFGSVVISALRKRYPETVLDVKLSCVNPENRIDEMVKAGADIISIHPESTFHFPAVINKIVSSNIAAGVVLNPGTPVSLIEALVADIDIVVVMLVNPGWGGKKYLSQAISKIKQIHELAETLKVPVPHISVDGGVSRSNSASLLEAGANVLVAGGSVISGRGQRASYRCTPSPP